MEQTQAAAMTDLSIVIFSSRDPAATVLQAIEYALIAAGSYSYQLHLFFNGDEQRAKTLTDLIRQHYPQASVQVWFFALADKANCMNLYWHQVKPAARMHFFVDGYVRLQPDSFSQLIKAHQTSTAHAFTGIPANGRSSAKLRRQMLSTGGIHGNLYMLPEACLQQLRAVQFYLPLGIYRTDPTMAALLCFDFQPQSQPWQPERIQVVAAAGWQFEQLRWYKLKDLKADLLRKKRQAQGYIENKAVRQLFAIEKQPAAALPEFATDLCLHYLQQHPLSWREYLRNPLLYFAIKDLKQRQSQQAKLAELKAAFWKFK
jgi:hypothetical protein